VASAPPSSSTAPATTLETRTAKTTERPSVVRRGGATTSMFRYRRSAEAPHCCTSKEPSSSRGAMCRSMEYPSRSVDRGAVEAEMRYSRSVRCLWTVRRRACGGDDDDDDEEEESEEKVRGRLSGEGREGLVFAVEADVLGGRGRRASMSSSVGGWVRECFLRPLLSSSPRRRSSSSAAFVLEGVNM